MTAFIFFLSVVVLFVNELCELKVKRMASRHFRADVRICQNGQIKQAT